MLYRTASIDLLYKTSLNIYNQMHTELIQADIGNEKRRNIYKNVAK